MTSTDVDFGEIEALFTVIEKCVAHSGKYTAIMSEASTRLQQIDADLREAQLEAKREAEQAEIAARPKAIPSEPEPEEVEGEDDGEVVEPAPIPARTSTAPQRRV